MTFVIITHVPHFVERNMYFAYGPYVREMNIWIRYVDKVIIVAPKTDIEKTTIDSSYEHNNIEFVPIESFNLLNVKSIIRTIFKTPKISWSIFKAMREANHIHLRCPGNMGLLGCCVQILFPSIPKTAKYAGNWDPKSKQPLTYKLQRWILSNNFLTRKMKVLVYGEWEGASKNIKPFFTATYNEADKKPLIEKDFKDKINFVFVGTLVKGKNPMFAVQFVELLSKKGYDVLLSLYGEGIERSRIEQYIIANQLETVIALHGNQSKAIVQKAYQDSHFVLLPSESEGWPKAIAEGMFWGCVPIATSVSCVPYMLDYGKRGLLLEMDLEKDVEQIQVLLDDAIEFENKRNNAAEWSRGYTLDVFEEAIAELLKAD